MINPGYAAYMHVTHPARMVTDLIVHAFIWYRCEGPEVALLHEAYVRIQAGCYRGPYEAA